MAFLRELPREHLIVLNPQAYLNLKWRRFVWGWIYYFGYIIFVAQLVSAVSLIASVAFFAPIGLLLRTTIARFLGEVRPLMFFGFLALSALILVWVYEICIVPYISLFASCMPQEIRAPKSGGCRKNAGRGLRYMRPP